MKRKWSLPVIAVLSAVMFTTGCGNKTSDVAVNADNTITYWVDFNNVANQKVSNMNDLEMYKQREKDTGIHIEFIHPPVGQAKEQFSLMVASRDLPDVIEYSWMTGSPGGPAKAIDDGIIIPLNDYIDELAPNFKSRLEEGDFADAYRKGSMTDNGEYYGFTNLTVGTKRVFGGMFLRKDWLDELGLQVPETIDEWTTVLRAFRDQKGAKAPLTGGIGLTSTPDYHHFNGAFDVGRELYLDGNTVKYAPLEAGFKDYLQLLHSWYEEGLLDNDYYTNTGEIVYSKMVTGVSGATYDFVGGGIGGIMDMAKDVPGYDLVGAPRPVLNKGDVNRFSQMATDVTDTALCITTACKNPEMVVEWADFWYSDEGMNLLNFGIEGETYNMVDGHAVYTDKILNNPDGLDVNMAMALTFRGQTTAPGLMQHNDYLDGRYQMPQQKQAFEVWNRDQDVIRATVLPIMIPNEQESAELAVISNDLKTYLDEMILKFIQGTESFDAYDSFVERLRTTFQAERYVELYQAMYDRYLER